MIGIWTGVDQNDKVHTVEEGGKFGKGIAEVMVPVFGANIIRVCIRMEDGSLMKGKIIETSFKFCNYEPNGKGYADYADDVREAMNLYTQAEKRQRERDAGRGYSPRKTSKSGASW